MDIANITYIDTCKGGRWCEVQWSYCRIDATENSRQWEKFNGEGEEMDDEDNINDRAFKWQQSSHSLRVLHLPAFQFDCQEKEKGKHGKKGLFFEGCGSHDNEFEMHENRIKYWEGRGKKKKIYVSTGKDVSVTDTRQDSKQVKEREREICEIRFQIWNLVFLHLHNIFCLPESSVLEN